MDIDEKIARAKRKLDRMAPDMGRDNSVTVEASEALFDAASEIATLREQLRLANVDAANNEADANELRARVEELEAEARRREEWNTWLRREFESIRLQVSKGAVVRSTLAAFDDRDRQLALMKAEDDAARKGEG